MSTERPGAGTLPAARSTTTVGPFLVHVDGVGRGPATIAVSVTYVPGLRARVGDRGVEVCLAQILADGVDAPTLEQVAELLFAGFNDPARRERLLQHDVLVTQVAAAIVPPGRGIRPTIAVLVAGIDR